MKLHISVLSLLVLLVLQANAQILPFEDFAAGNNTGIVGWTTSATPGSYNAPGGVNAWAHLSGNTNNRMWATKTFAAPFHNPVLNTNPCVLGWAGAFHVTYNQTGNIGFGINEGIVAYVLGGTSPNLTNGNGYALVLGDYVTGTSSNQVSLVRYTGGLDNVANITTIISAPYTIAQSLVGFRVTFDPSNGMWSLFSGTWQNPEIAATPLGTPSSDAVHGGIPLGHIGIFHNYSSTGVTRLARFDNLYIPGCASNPTVDFGTPVTEDWEANLNNTSIPINVVPVSSSALNVTVQISSNTSCTYGLNPNDYVLTNATTLLPNNVNPTSATFTIPANQGTFNMQLVVQDDADFNYDNIVFEITAVSGATSPAIGSDVIHEVRIQDDDAPPTVLGIGDLAVVGVSANHSCSGLSTSDEFSFFCFQDITQGTSLDFTDNAYDRILPSAGFYASNEGTFRITRTGYTIPAGTVVTLQNLNGNLTYIQPDAQWSSVKSGNFNISQSGGGDQVIVLQGGFWNGSGTTVDYQGGSALYGFSTDATGWQSFANSNNKSGVPASLDCFTMSPLVSSSYNKFDPANINGAFDQRTWMILINDPSNWTDYSSCNDYVSQGPQFASGFNFDITSTGFTSGVWRGAEDSDWFNCRNWDDAQIPDASIDVLIDSRAIRDCVVDGGSVAACQNLDILQDFSAAGSLSVLNGSTLSINGNLTLDRTSNINRAEVRVETGSLIEVHDITLTGTPNAIYAGPGNGGASALRLDAAGARVDASGNFTMNTGSYFFSGATGGTLELEGNWINDFQESAFVSFGGEVILDGSGPQMISGSYASGITGIEAFNILEINKPSGDVIVPNTIAINSAIRFVNGRILNTGQVIFGTTASHSGVSDASFVNGQVTKKGAANFVFPIGKVPYYRPIEISSQSSANNNTGFTAEYFDTNPQVPHGNTLAATLDHISACEYWMLDRESGNPNAFVRLFWDNVLSCGVTNTADLRVARQDGSVWQDHGNASLTGTAATGSLQSSALITQFSPFTLGSISLDNPLPVELLDFNAQAMNTYVQLNWSTASEINNDYFEVQRSQDGLTFTTIDEVWANGTTNTVSDYQSFDMNPLGGLSYYRLRQVDYDGAFEYSDLVAVEFGQTSNTAVWVNGATLVLSHSHIGKGVKIFDAAGRIVYEGILEGNTRDTFDIAALSAGLYTIRVFDGESGFAERFVR